MLSAWLLERQRSRRRKAALDWSLAPARAVLLVDV